MKRTLLLLISFFALFGEPIFESRAVYSPMIVIDPGHGGGDRGARANDPYCEEKKITLSTAKLVKKHLVQLGYRVVMTRETDASISLPRRVEIASQADADLFVSVHFNSTSSVKVSGIEVFFSEYSSAHGATASRAPSSRKLADLVLSAVIGRTEAVSRGVKRGNFYVIRETSMPAVLVEGGFISNQEERTQLRTKEFQDKIAIGIAEGIDAYFKKNSEKKK